jgi:glycosyltransferase involved in cell wall biosynthesis
MKNKHVLMLAPDCYMIDRRILQEARSLIHAGYRVTLLSCFETPKEAHYFQDGIEIHRYRYDWGDERIKEIENKCLRWLFHIANRLIYLRSFNQFILHKARRFQADIVHVHDLPMLWYGVHLAKTQSIPLVFDAHEIHHEGVSLTPLMRRIFRYIEKRYIPNTNLFITVNENAADYFQKMHGKRPMVLMNCADKFKNFDRKICRKQLRDKAELSAEARIILYQGWISAERNLDTLIKASEHLPSGVYLCLIGYGYYEESLKTLVAEKELNDKVRFLGRVEPENILHLTAGADIGVIPYLPIDMNHMLCSPNKLFEYIQANVPIVSHKLPFMEWMAQQYRVLTLGDFSSVESSAETLLSVLDSPKQLEDMYNACVQAAELLNWETESLKLLKAYENLLFNF